MIIHDAKETLPGEKAYIDILRCDKKKKKNKIKDKIKKKRRRGIFR